MHLVPQIKRLLLRMIKLDLICGHLDFAQGLLLDVHGSPAIAV